MKQLLFVAMGLSIAAQLSAQIAAGPMLGPVSFKSATLWMSFEKKTESARVRYWPHNGNKATSQEAVVQFQSSQSAGFVPYNIQHFLLAGLEPGTTYEYELLVTDSKPGLPVARQPIRGSFTTQTLFQWRTNAPDFSFLTGSCAYVNQPAYDRPGKPYGGDSSIFETMAKEQAAFMLWLGDNWYTRDVDYTTAHGLWYRAIHDRSQPVYQNFWRKMGHIAIWDDHDFGPNDYGKSYPFSGTTAQVFNAMWLNPTAGENGKGIYTRYTYSDVDFFMLDDRTWRDFDGLPDSVNGKPNPNKRMFGRQQLEWLKNELRYSKGNPHISFRVIATGSQVLNPVSPFDKLLDCPVEYYELINFLRDEKIDGVVFLTGDRHHSEIIKVQYDGLYPLYDITVSPLTSGTHKFGGVEGKNPYRVLGIDQLQNYGRLSVSGARSNRQLTINFLGVKGENLGTWSVSEKDLKTVR